MLSLQLHAVATCIQYTITRLLVNHIYEQPRQDVEAEVRLEESGKAMAHLGPPVKPPLAICIYML